MSTLAQTRQPAPVPNGDCYSPFRMSIDQYERLVDSGVFTKRDKLQLVSEGYDLAREYKMGHQVPVIRDGIEVGRINVSDILP
jgi:hypothetical protein